jgi:hypothetical protein
MRITATMTDLNEQEWSYLHRVVQTEYEMGQNFRVCLTFSRQGEDRHVELPMHVYGSILTGLAVHSAMAALRPQDLAGYLESQRNEADPARRMGQSEPACEHGTIVVDVKPSVFEGAPPVRHHADGCESYGPYAKGQGHGAGWND